MSDATQQPSRLSAILSTSFTIFLVVGMLAAGTFNTLITKYQDVQVVKGLGDGPGTAFEHALYVCCTKYF